MHLPTTATTTTSLITTLIFLGLTTTALLIPTTQARIVAINCYDNRTSHPSSQIWFYKPWKGYPTTKPEPYDPQFALTITDGTYHNWERPEGTRFDAIPGSRMTCAATFTVSPNVEIPVRENRGAGASVNEQGVETIIWFGAGQGKVLTSVDWRGYGCYAVYYGLEIPVGAEGGRLVRVDMEGIMNGTITGDMLNFD
ncbi:hypothetical protein HDV05_002763 [Chytridiales sp. JEL 0842]|nr:hypothetical protein HDV05_002763 [Chytridiales sp. JEL 0842]